MGSDLLALIDIQRIGSLYVQKRKRHGHSSILKMSVNRESLILGVPSLYNPRAVLQIVPIIGVLCALIVDVVNIDVVRPKYECQQSVKSFRCCIWYDPRAKLRLLSIIEVLAV